MDEDEAMVDTEKLTMRRRRSSEGRERAADMAIAPLARGGRRRGEGSEALEGRTTNNRREQQKPTTE